MKRAANTPVKLMALATKHQPMPTPATNEAATTGPRARPTLTNVLLSVTAFRINRGPTISGMNAIRAGLSSAVSAPNTSAAANTIHSSIAPSSTSAPRTSDTAASDACVTSNTVRLSARSTIRPAYGVSSSTGR